MKIIQKSIKISPEVRDLDGIRILHIGDLHLRGENKKIGKFMNRLSKLNFDFLFITGDIIDDNRGIKWACRYLKKLKPKYESWFVLGNHDEFNLNLYHLFAFNKFKNRTKRNNIKLLFSSLKEMGVKVLLNESDGVKIGNSLIKITGIMIPLGIDRVEPNHHSFTERLKELELFFFKQKKKKNEFSIVLTHLPDMVGLINDMKADLYLAGHTHGGQIRLPFIGPVFTFSKFQKKYNKGLFKMPNGSYLNITAGVGQSKATPFRLFCPSEATLITLKCRC